MTDDQLRSRIAVHATINAATFAETAPSSGRTMAWRYTPASRRVLSQRLYVTGMSFTNVGTNGVVLDRGQAQDVGWRADATFAPRED